MKRRQFLLAATAPVALGGGTRPTGTGLDAVDRVTETGHDTVAVPVDEATIQSGVDAAEPGDLVLVSPGVYEEAVTVDTPEITVRGRDRNGVVLEGSFERTNGIDVEADGVAVENLTVRHYRSNGVYWSDVRGFRASYVTAYNNGYYGVYATHSRDGRFEYSYASGHPDAGFYLGRNQPFEAVVANVLAERNGMGYSGTSTGEGVTVRDSIWRYNVTGIAPNTLDTADPAQHSTRVLDNVVYANDHPDAPAVDYVYPTFGTGIVLWGASDNLVRGNVVDDHDNFGIVAHHNVVAPEGNAIRDNVVRRSGEADLALGTPAGAGNEFADNRFATALPETLSDGTAAAGADRVTEVFDAQRRRAKEGGSPGGDYRDQPEPGALPTMRDPTAPPRPATRFVSMGP